MRARNWLRSFRKAVRPLLRPARRWVWSPHEIWKRAILHEVAWWDHYLAVKRGEGYVYRTDPDAVLRSPLVIRALERMGKPDVANGAFMIRHARGEVNVSHALFREATTEAALVGDEVHCFITRR